MLEVSGKISHPQIARFSPHSRGIAPAYLPKATRAMVSSSKRILIMFKPDCLGLEMVPEGLQILKQGLDREKINFRVAGLVLLNMTPQMSDMVYAEHKGKDWYEGINKPFMTGNHPSKDAISAPIIAAMLEIKNDPGRDLIGIIRKNIIGPTDVEDAPDKEAIKNTVRSRLILDKGLLTWPFPQDENGPNYNRIHCSANEKDAPGELYPIFGLKGILSLLYEPNAVKDVLASFGHNDFANIPGVVRIPLHEYLGSDPEVLSKKMIKALSDNGYNYKDFDAPKAARLVKSLNGMKDIIHGQGFF